MPQTLEGEENYSLEQFYAMSKKHYNYGPDPQLAQTAVEQHRFTAAENVALDVFKKKKKLERLDINEAL